MSFNEYRPIGLVSVAELMEILDISRTTLHRWLALGLPSHQLVPRGRRYFDLTEVEAWVKSRCTSPTPASGTAEAAS